MGFYTKVNPVKNAEQQNKTITASGYWYKLKRIQHGGVSENREVNNSEGFLIANAVREGRRRHLNWHANGVKLPSCSEEESIACLMLVLLFLYFIATKQHHSSVALLSSFYQNHWPGWWENAWNNYSEARFKKTFRISWSTFKHILNRIGPFFAKETVAEDPVSPELRPSLCLCRKQVYFVFFRHEEQDCAWQLPKN